jgi:hypothetical protein
MPLYLIRLEAPVVYQPDSIKRREITELPVRSDDPDQAVSHLHRSTRGLVRVASIEVVKP